MHPFDHPGKPAPQVLILDDDYVSRTLLGKMLSMEGIETLATGSEGEAYKILQRPEVGMLIQDFTREAGTMGGFRFLQQLRKDARTRNLPTVIVSGTPRCMIEGVFREGGSHWRGELIGLFSKPLDREHIIKLVRIVRFCLTGRWDPTSEDSGQDAEGGGISESTQ